MLKLVLVASSVVLQCETLSVSQWPTFGASEHFARNDVQRCLSSTAAGWTKHDPPTERDQPRDVTKIFYVNLKKSTERDHAMKKYCHQFAGSVPCDRFDAVDKKHVPSMNLSDYSSGRHAEWMSKLNKDTRSGFTAISLSNYKVLQHILEEYETDASPESIFMILEDDTRLDRNWQADLVKILQHTPSDWMHLRVGYKGQVRCEDKVNSHIYSIRGPSHLKGSDKVASGAHHNFYQGNDAYLVKLKHIPHILATWGRMHIQAVENMWYLYTPGSVSPTNKSSMPDLRITSYAVAPDKKITHEENGFASTRYHRVEKPMDSAATDLIEPDAMAGREQELQDALEEM